MRLPALVLATATVAAACGRDHPAFTKVIPTAAPTLSAKPGESWSFTTPYVNGLTYGPGVIVVTTNNAGSRKVLVLAERTGEVLATIEANDVDLGLRHPTFSPDGRTLAYVRDVADNPSTEEQLVVLDVSSGRRQITSLGATKFLDVSLIFASDGSAVFAVIQLHHLVRFALANGVSRTGEVDVFPDVPRLFQLFPIGDGGLSAHDGEGTTVTLDRALHPTRATLPGAPFSSWIRMLRASPPLWQHVNSDHLWTVADGAARDLGERGVLHFIARRGADGVIVVHSARDAASLEILDGENATTFVAPLSFSHDLDLAFDLPDAGQVRTGGGAVAFLATSGRTIHVVRLPE